MVEATVRARCPEAVPLAEAMIAVLRGIPGPRAVETERWYAAACWARAAFEHGMVIAEAESTEAAEAADAAAVVAARHASRWCPDEPAGMWGRRVAFDAAPVRVVYLLEIAARLQTGDHPRPLPKTASRTARAAVAAWNERVRWCEAMLYGSERCMRYLAVLLGYPPEPRAWR